ncbi:geranylgeranylglycerol-phosphate geranylgeranyltransferase [Haloarchaeobius iranensis]|uniref:Digeranylgeranylglyceryl phosphate synthase n=1 Tax=Haloarchaeobius iranensis TaxID=996166 RepID=A0A1G9WQ14_9EURY|nr:geranylgeranylglycerol-phosphate geranylgeranyltransferase [Haloarchaeobius iranensis]SDM86263.1 geranylgeranylglycerol-phosphate geranylgeranyltransferase [Haloarchaeobius iranensis]
MTTTRDRLAGLLELTRPVNSLVAGLLTFIGAFVAVGASVFDPGPATNAVGAVAATVLAAAAGNAINDYFDRDIDRINDPDRAIPRGAVTPRGALLWSGALFVGAAVAAVFLPLLAIGIAAFNLLSLVLYTKFFKGTPGFGNLLVAYLGGSTFLFGGAAVGNAETSATLFALAALSTVSREIIKDVEDIDGDREEGLTTLPVAIGERRALLVAAGALGLAVLASPVPYFTGTFGVVYLVAVAPADAVMAYAAYEGFSDPTASQSRLKYGMFLAAGAFIVGRAVVAFG